MRVALKSDLRETVEVEEGREEGSSWEEGGLEDLEALMRRVTL